MHDFTRLLEAAHAGDRLAADDLLPIVYDELRNLAAAKMANERADHTLDATALVHEAYLRLSGPNSFACKSHFFRAAAEAMRCILIDNARTKRSRKRGGEGKRFELHEADRIQLPDTDTLLTIEETLTALAIDEPQAAEIARLRLFAGLTLDETADALGISKPAAFRDWSFARANLALALRDSE